MWVVVARLSSVNSSVLHINTNTEYPTRESFKTYYTAGDDEPYIAAEISNENYPARFTVGDHLLTSNISDFSDLDHNGPLEEGRDYGIFVRFFSYNAQVSLAIQVKFWGIIDFINLVGSSFQKEP